MLVRSCKYCDACFDQNLDMLSLGDFRCRAPTSRRTQTILTLSPLRSGDAMEAGVGIQGMPCSLRSTQTESSNAFFIPSQILGIMGNPMKWSIKYYKWMF